MLPITPLPGVEPDPVGPVTRSTVLGVVVGVIALPTCALATDGFPLQIALAAGLLGGLAGGIGWGLLCRRR
jgi:hypothetical protein